MQHTCEHLAYWKKFWNFEHTNALFNIVLLFKEQKVPETFFFTCCLACFLHFCCCRGVICYKLATNVLVQMSWEYGRQSLSSITKLYTASIYAIYELSRGVASNSSGCWGMIPEERNQREVAGGTACDCSIGLIKRSVGSSTSFWCFIRGIFWKNFMVSKHNEISNESIYQSPGYP